ncbi:hypothetical protein SZ28_00915 [Burkholderia pseudomallei]|nr:hypothetical protein SZ28_00915 [Burkholderia pseudomallei]
MDADAMAGAVAAAEMQAAGAARIVLGGGESSRIASRRIALRIASSRAEPEPCQSRARAVPETEPETETETETETEPEPETSPPLD